MTTFWVRFKDSNLYCGHELAEIQKTVNTNIAPFLKGYSARATEMKNTTWHFGRNPVVLKKTNEKTSFFVYRQEQTKGEKHTMSLTKQEQALLYEKGFFTAGADNAIVVITKTKLSELGIILEEDTKKGKK